jgi:hypothetical protein
MAEQEVLFVEPRPCLRCRRLTRKRGQVAWRESGVAVVLPFCEVCTVEGGADWVEIARRAMDQFGITLLRISEEQVGGRTSGIDVSVLEL